MGCKIRVLTDKTINQIAAGEVIEDPSSVVKELVENAIDARATSIKIEIMGGGHFQIRVIDNGSGMSRDDAFLAFERHATSKLVDVTDLQKIVSMGFRGEALASIAACSKVELISCEEGAQVGTKVVIHGSKMFKQESISRSHGTTIEVSSLFYNIPARKAFQKSTGQSTNDMTKMVTRLALAHPDIALELISHGESLLKTTGDVDHVIEQVLGVNFSSQMRKLQYEMNDCKISGVISTPENTRRNRTGQYIFINHRPINSSVISKAVQEAYGTRLSTSEYPLFVLWLEIPSHLIDVNVHPQKSEVRFRNEEMVQNLVISAIGKVFGSVEAIFHSDKKKLDNSYTSMNSFPKYPSYPDKLSEPTINYEVHLTTTMEKKRPLLVLGVFDRFAIVQFEKGATLFGEDECHESLGFIDMHGVEKRLLFDHILSLIKSHKESEKQQLLFTETFEFTPAEASQIKEKMPLLNQMGIGIREFGDHTFVVESLANHIEMDDVRDLILETSPKMNEEGLAKKFLAKFRGKKTYLHSEVISMVEKLLKSSDPGYCPSGKRLLKVFSVEEFGDWLGKNSAN